MSDPRTGEFLKYGVGISDIPGMIFAIPLLRLVQGVRCLKICQSGFFTRLSGLGAERTWAPHDPDHLRRL